VHSRAPDSTTTQIRGGLCESIAQARAGAPRIFATTVAEWFSTCSPLAQRTPRDENFNTRSNTVYLSALSKT